MISHSNPLVSVLMTAYNRENYIAEAIESVLSSTYQNFELIITDDCSKDATPEIVRRYAIKDPRVKLHINEKNLGDYKNRNMAASLAKGKYIKYLDSDDVMYPYTLQIMTDYMEQYPDAGYGLSAVHDVKPYPICISPRQAYLEHFLTWGHFFRAPGSSIIKKECFDKVGGFSGERFVGDTLLWFTLGRYFDLVKIPPNLTWNREHPHQESKFERQQAKVIDQVREKITTDAMNHPDCPLNEEDKIQIKNYMGKIKRKQTVQKLLKKLVK